MAKRNFKPSTMLCPLPSVMVSCGTMEDSNIITIAWTGIINSDPPRTYISVQPKRWSHHMISEKGEFVINLVTKDLAAAMDWAGCVRGEQTDKFESLKLTKEYADIVDAPMILESPINLECKVFDVQHLGSHDMFLADIVAVHVDESVIDESDRVALEKLGLVSLIHGKYYAAPRQSLGRMGFSVMKPKTKKRINGEHRTTSRRKNAESKR